MELNTKVLKKTTASKVFSTLFEIIDVAKKAHLTAEGKSYARHMALGSFYESLQDKTDTFIETYQGKYGIIDFELTTGSTKNMSTYIKDKLTFLEGSYDVFKDGYLKNQLDSIIEECYHLTYKLDNLL